MALGFFERRIIQSSEEGADLAMCIVVEHGPKAEAVEGFMKEEGYSEAGKAEAGNDPEFQAALEKLSIVQISSFKNARVSQQVEVSRSLSSTAKPSRSTDLPSR